jgi:hypothetical protein
LRKKIVTLNAAAFEELADRIRLQISGDQEIAAGREAVMRPVC